MAENQQPTPATMSKRHWERAGGTGQGWQREGHGLPVDEQEVRHEAQHIGDGGGNGQVALKVVLQAQK